jgi:hypothetical protein
MCAAEGNVWKLSYADLARYCQELGHNASTDLDPAIREEARRLYGAWTDALAINLHQEGAAERQANITLGLRKRTIELLFKSGVGVG